MADGLFFASLCGALKEWSYRLLILDTLARFHRLDENSATDMARVIGRLETIVVETGCTVLFCHHTNKSMSVSGRGHEQQAARGSSVLTDHVRWQAYMSNMSSDEAKKYSVRSDSQPIGEARRGYYVRYGIAKQNYGRPYPGQWYERGKEGILSPVRLHTAGEIGESSPKRAMRGWRREG